MSYMMLSLISIGTAVIELRIIRQPQPWGAIIEEYVTFTISASSKNGLTFEWTLDGKAIGQYRESEIKQTESPDRKSSTIRMKFSPNKHAGMYKCVVSDKIKGESLSSNEVELRGELHNKSYDFN